MTKLVIKRENRNGKTESIRVPIHIVDMIKDLASHRGITFQQMTTEMVIEWIKYKNVELDKKV